MRLYIVLLVLILTGCSNNYPVKFDSTPQGASVICSGQNFGYTPITLYYDKDKIRNDTIINDCKAQWSSGASANFPSRIRVYPTGGTVVTLPRPNVPGHTQDAEFALKLKSINSSNQQHPINSNPFSTTINCRKMGEFLNVEIKTFSGSFCPLGWYPAN